MHKGLKKIFRLSEYRGFAFPESDFLISALLEKNLLFRGRNKVFRFI